MGRKYQDTITELQSVSYSKASNISQKYVFIGARRF